MKIDIKEEKENPFMKRKEIWLNIDHSTAATPTKAALQQLVSKQFSHELTKTDVRQIFTETGMAKSRAKVFIWTEKEVPDLSIKEAPAAKAPAEDKAKADDTPKETTKSEKTKEPVAEEAAPEEKKDEPAPVEEETKEGSE